MKKRSGFTLVEVMVVLVIIAVLATAGISSYSYYIARSSDLDAEAEVQKLIAATLEFKSNHNGRSPTKIELDEYMASKQNVTKIASSFLPQAWAQTLTNIKHPAGGKPICIRTDGNGEYMANDAPCEIVYYTFSDGKIAFSAGVRTKAMLQKNFHAAVVEGRTTYGMFAGTSPVISRPEKTIEDAIVAYNAANPTQQITANAVGLTPIEVTGAPNTTIPDTTIPPSVPPVSTPPVSGGNPNPETTIPSTDPITTTEDNFPTGGGITSVPESMPAPDTTTPLSSNNPETTYTETTSEYYYPTTWSAETTYMETTSEVPQTTGSYTCRHDDQCAVDEYCDDSASVEQGFLSSLWSWIIQSYNGFCQSLSLLPSSSDTSNIPVSTYAGGGTCRVDSDCSYGYKCVGAWWNLFNIFGGTCTPVSEFGETTTEYSTNTWGETTTNWWGWETTTSGPTT